MPTAIAVRFPLGRYHATPWDRAVNEGEVEWPPSPWRLLRTLVATWHARWPELPPERLDAIITALASTSPSYRAPTGVRAHTRHYMPDGAHRSGLPSTDLVLDPFLWIDPDAELVVQWEVDVTNEARADLTKLCELVPYLGRSESIVRVELLDGSEAPDESWWCPDRPHRPTVQLLEPAPEITRGELEITTSEVRRRRLPLPPRTRLRSYGRVEPPPTPAAPSPSATLGAIRWRLETSAPFRDEQGILATEWLRTSRLWIAERALGGRLTPSLKGKIDDVKVDDAHAHAHWLWLAHDGRVEELALLLPANDLDARVAAAMVADSSFDGFRNWNPTGFRPGRIHVVAMGEPTWVLHELVGTSDTWTARTPYLPVRHRKRKQSIEEWVWTDIAHECAYRGLPEPADLAFGDDAPPSAASFRRYRWRESMRERREGFWVGIRFDTPAPSEPAVLSLGALSHFGFGLFQPEG